MRQRRAPTLGCAATRATSTPAGFTWSYASFAYGWDPVKTTTTAGAAADAFGAQATWTPTMEADQAAQTVTLTYGPSWASAAGAA